VACISVGCTVNLGVSSILETRSYEDWYTPTRALCYYLTIYNYNSLTLPHSLIGSIANGQAGLKLLEQRGGNALGEDVDVL